MVNPKRKTTTMTKTPRRLGAPAATTMPLTPEKPKRSRKKAPEAAPLLDPTSVENMLASPAPMPAKFDGLDTLVRSTAFKDGRLDFFDAKRWRFILFTDLHVSAKTLDRALALLAYVRECAVANEAHVVCLGDFWDQRSTLAVRQLDAVQREFEAWRDAGVHLVMVPGNHDQVSLDGAVNAVRIFDAYPHIHVMSEPFFDRDAGIAFVPWCEEPARQEATFGALTSMSDTTIFAHAEVAGAVANSGKAAAGRVSLTTIEKAARACYVGHYHKRQKLGEKTWYIGSPFEMSFGERDEPHGIALVTNEEVEPAFLDLDDFPKHYRLTLPIDAPALAHPRPHDIVELVMSEEDLAGPALREALKKVKATDVRPVPAPKTAATKGAAPALAVTLEGAIASYVNTLPDAAIDDDTRDRLVRLGNEVLASVPDARALTPYAPLVRMTKVIIDDFCAIKGHFDLDLAKLGPVLLRGPMGSGKTSICDAITWALYGTTTPRKPGTQGGTLRADDVVHDNAEEAHVRVCFDCILPSGDRVPVAVDRVKKRGTGAKVRIYGSHGIPEGATVEEQQIIIHKLVGLDLDLWRACVYLGQGAVANFITDADKRRKDLLSRAFGLGACEPALKLVREHGKRAAADVSAHKMRLAEATAGLAALATLDVRVQAEQWEAQRAAHVAQLRATRDEAIAHADAIKPHLAHEEAWLDRQRQYDAHIAGLARSLVASTSDRTNKLSADLGGVQAERSVVDRDIAKAHAAYSALVASRATGISNCGTCGQVLPVESVEDHIAEHEASIARLRTTATTLAARASNIASELEGARGGDTAAKESIRAQMEEAQTHLKTVNEALSAIARMKQAHDDHARRAVEADALLGPREREANPFVAQQREAESRKATLGLAKQDAETKLGIAERSASDFGVWEDGFSAKGLPVIVLRTVLHELETHANAYLARLLAGRIMCKLSLVEDDLIAHFYEWNVATGTHTERSYLQLSGGQRRCVELAFSPFALSDMIFARVGVRVSFLVVDELTTHLDPDTKPLVCRLLQTIERDTVLVIDHDQGVLGEFDKVLDVVRAADGSVTTARGGA